MTPIEPSFEVQLSRKGRWYADSRHHDQRAAEAAAKALAGADTPIEGVRVTREQFDAKTNRFATTVVFRGMPGELDEPDAARDARNAERRNERARQKSAPTSRPQSAPWRVLPFRIVLLVAAASAILTALGGFIWLHWR
ncbi:MAG TPA: hypothetical protein VKS60_20430 [Stellaceae bacterium]|nr:hypothetical protein [Stellaceae bacterium]